MAPKNFWQKKKIVGAKKAIYIFLWILGGKNFFKKQLNFFGGENLSCSEKCLLEPFSLFCLKRKKNKKNGKVKKMHQTFKLIGPPSRRLKVFRKNSPKTRFIQFPINKTSKAGGVLGVGNKWPPLVGPLGGFFIKIWSLGASLNITVLKPRKIFYGEREKRFFTKPF